MAGFIHRDTKDLQIRCSGFDKIVVYQKVQGSFKNDHHPIYTIVTLSQIISLIFGEYKAKHFKVCGQIMMSVKVFIARQNSKCALEWENMY